MPTSSTSVGWMRDREACCHRARHLRRGARPAPRSERECTIGHQGGHPARRHITARDSDTAPRRRPAPPRPVSCITRFRRRQRRVGQGGSVRCGLRAVRRHPLVAERERSDGLPSRFVLGRRPMSRRGRPPQAVHRQTHRPSVAGPPWRDFADDGTPTLDKVIRTYSSQPHGTDHAVALRAADAGGPRSPRSPTPAARRAPFITSTPAAGGLAQAAAQQPRCDARGAATLRERIHHLYAHRQHLAVGELRRPRPARRARHYVRRGSMSPTHRGVSGKAQWAPTTRRSPAGDRFRTPPRLPVSCGATSSPWPTWIQRLLSDGRRPRRSDCDHQGRRPDSISTHLPARSSCRPVARSSPSAASLAA